MHLVSLLFGYRGRVNRAQYWLGTIAVSVVNWIVMVAILATSTMPADKNPAAALAAASSQLALVLPISFGLSWIAFALQVKRFHDRGQSGWWSMLPAAPVFFMMMNLFSAVSEQWSVDRLMGSLGMPMLALVVISLGLFVNLGCLPGTQGPNKFGDPPGSAPSSVPPVRPSAAPAAPKAAPVMSLGGAESAMERAIAARAQAPQTQAPKVSPLAQQRPAMPPRGAPSPGGFGRRPAT